MTFALQDYILLAVALVNSALAGYVLVRNPRHLVHRSFFIFVVSVSAWMASLVLLLATHFLVLNQFIFYTGITAVFGLFLLSSTFPATKQLSKQFWILSLPILILYVGVPFNVYVSGITVSASGAITPINGPAFPFLLLVFVVYTISSFWAIIQRYRKASGATKGQIQYFFLGIFFFFVTILITDVVLPAVGIYQFNSIGAIASILFTTLTGYAIVENRLFDLRLLLFRTISFINVLVLFAASLAVILFAGATLIFHVHITAGQYVFGLILMVTAMLVFQPLQRLVRRFTNRFFFQGIYDSERLLSELTRVMAETIDIDEVTSQLLALVKERMHVSKGAFLLVNEHRISDVKSVDYPGSVLQVPDLERLLHDRSHRDKHILYDDLQDMKLKELFGRLDISVAIPITVETNEVAVLVLGPKLSGESYYQRDIDVLDIFASEAGVAIQNAKSYAEIKRFSTHLEQMVEERTKQLEEAQKREIEKAQGLAKLKDEFVFVAAHELRTPVTVIRGFMDMVQTSGERFSKEIQEYFSRIQLASNHLNQLVDDLLQVARSDAGTVKVEVSAIDSASVIEEVVQEVTPLAEAKKITLRVHAEKGLPQALADAAKVKEVATNLLSNAIKYNRESGTIEVNLVTKAEHVVVEVKDTGYGIPKDQQAKIFQKFFRAESEHTKDVVGTGLGLFITRMLVEKMGGTISFVSREGVGTTFSFVLPIAK